MRVLAPLSLHQREHALPHHHASACPLSLHQREHALPITVQAGGKLFEITKAKVGILESELAFHRQSYLKHLQYASSLYEAVSAVRPGESRGFAMSDMTRDA